MLVGLLVLACGSPTPMGQTSQARTAANTAPVADAGADSTVSVGNTATLDASGSTDADGDALTHRWKFLKVPAGSALWSNDIADRDADVTTFTPDVQGTYIASVLVGDGTDTDRDDVTVSVTAAGNTAPVAVALDVTGEVGETLVLDGSSSSDAEGDALTYRWKFIRLPSGSSLNSNDIDDRDAATTSFVPDVVGVFRAYLRVDDGSLTDADDQKSTVSAGSSNTAPVADAGADASLTLGDAGTLDASGSSDADGDALTYRWKVLSVPSGSGLWSNDIGDRNAASTTFTPDVEGTYQFNVRVEDGTTSDSDQVTWSVAAAGVETDCSDGLDDDGDGLVDCEDGDCTASSACGEVCDDGTDDDADGWTDCADSDCWGVEGCAGTAVRVAGGHLHIQRDLHTYFSFTRSQDDQVNFTAENVSGTLWVFDGTALASCGFGVGRAQGTWNYNLLRSDSTHSLTRSSVTTTGGCGLSSSGFLPPALYAERARDTENAPYRDRVVLPALLNQRDFPRVSPDLGERWYTGSVTSSQTSRTGQYWDFWDFDLDWLTTMEVELGQGETYVVLE